MYSVAGPVPLLGRPGGDDRRERTSVHPLGHQDVWRGGEHMRHDELRVALEGGGESPLVA